jgi:phage FluMu protein Com
MVQPLRCRICDSVVLFDEGTEGVCPQCAQLLEEMAEIAAEADTRS